MRYLAGAREPGGDDRGQERGAAMPALTSMELLGSEWELNRTQVRREMSASDERERIIFTGRDAPGRLFRGGIFAERQEFVSCGPPLHKLRIFPLDGFSPQV